MFIIRLAVAASDLTNPELAASSTGQLSRTLLSKLVDIPSGIVQVTDGLTSLPITVKSLVEGIL